MDFKSILIEDQCKQERAWRVLACKFRKKIHKGTYNPKLARETLVERRLPYQHQLAILESIALEELFREKYNGLTIRIFEANGQKKAFIRANKLQLEKFFPKVYHLVRTRMPECQFVSFIVTSNDVSTSLAEHSSSPLTLKRLDAILDLEEVINTTKTKLGEFINAV